MSLPFYYFHLISITRDYTRGAVKKKKERKQMESIEFDVGGEIKQSQPYIYSYKHFAFKANP